MHTGSLSTPQSQPGSFQPGYFCTGKAVWKGPFPAGELTGYSVGAANPIDVVSGTFTVPLATASRMADSDQTWWEFH